MEITTQSYLESLNTTSSSPFAFAFKDLFALRFFDLIAEFSFEDSAHEPTFQCCSLISLPSLSRMKKFGLLFDLFSQSDILTARSSKGAGYALCEPLCWRCKFGTGFHLGNQ
jgi:hypothetical protein